MSSNEKYVEIVELLDGIRSAKTDLAALDLGEINAFNMIEKAKHVAPAMIELGVAVESALVYVLEHMLEEVNNGSENSDG